MSDVTLPNYIIEQKHNQNYGLDMIGVKELWEKSIKGNNVNIAVIDTGCDINHGELKENIMGYYNFTNDDGGDPNNVTDYLGHGTHVAGIIGSKNYTESIGVAPESNLVILKVINKSGVGNIKALIEAIRYAIDWKGPDNSKIDIINLSLGTPLDKEPLREIIDRGIYNNISVVAASGNYGDGNSLTSEITYPGFYKDVFQIGAVDKHYKPTVFSNSNKNIDFLAPGKNIYSTFPKNQYKVLSGTSMAAPHVSGVIALIKNLFCEKRLEISNITVENYIIQKALYLPKYPSTIQGYGLIHT